LIAGLFVFFTFGSTALTVTTESGGSSQQTTSHFSWFESQGWWGVTILIIFALLFYAVLHFYQRGKLAWTVVFGLTVIALSVLAGFSIGTAYWPGSLAVLIGLFLLPFRARQAK
jgi:hypothetical protein